MFEHARLKLTAWYLVIIMTISILFSMVIYVRVSSDLTKFEHMQVRLFTDFREGRIREIPGPGPRSFAARLDPSEIRQARTALVIILGIINLTILAVAGAAGYFLAGKTLMPIKQMMEEQKRFVSDSSHEFRTPLTSLRSEIEVGLRNKKLTLTKARKILKSNLEEVINMQALSENLLMLAQNGKSFNKNAMEKVSIKTIIQSAVRRIEPAAKNKEIKVENSMKDAKVNGVPDRLGEVFVILLDNAVKYSPKRSRIELKSKLTKGKIEVSVINHGVGISEEDLPHIFDRFYRSDKSRSEAGFGLGLSIAKKIVENHKGQLSVSSKPNYTVFIVTLPRIS